jgi:hypothetical protein
MDACKHMLTTLKDNYDQSIMMNFIRILQS